MSAAEEVIVRKKLRRGGPSDVYTALLGLATLALAGALAVVLATGAQMFGGFAEALRIAKP